MKNLTADQISFLKIPTTAATTTADKDGVLRYFEQDDSVLEEDMLAFRERLKELRQRKNRKPL